MLKKRNLASILQHVSKIERLPIVCVQHLE